MIKNPEPLSDELFTRIVDADAHWGPLLFLRPRVEESLSTVRVLLLSGLLGSVFGLLGSIFLAVAARALHKPSVGVHVFPLALIALYFCASQLTFVPAWNRRAKRLSGV